MRVQREHGDHRDRQRLTDRADERHGAAYGARQRPRRLGAQHLLDGIDDVFDGANGLELLGLDALFRQLLQTYGEIDRVDTVEVEVVVETSFRRDLRRARARTASTARAAAR